MSVTWSLDAAAQLEYQETQAWTLAQDAYKMYIVFLKETQYEYITK